MPNKVAPDFARIHAKPDAPAPTIAGLLKLQMEGVASNPFMRAEKTAGKWSGGQEVLTFDEAYKAACSFAVATLAVGLGPGTRVAVFCANGVEYTLAVLGCHLAGSACVLREPDMPIGELVMVTRATKPHMVLLTPGSPTEPDFISQMAALSGDEARKVVPWQEADKSTIVDGVGGVAVTLLMCAGACGGGGDFPGRGGPQVDSAAVKGFEPGAVPPDAVALICMTSGTTGTPKGVMHTQEGLAWMCQTVMDPLWYNAATLGPRTPGDCVPTLLTFQSGYISGYLVIAAAATLHLQMTFADTPELQSWLATQSWPREASPVVQMLLPAVITKIWKGAGPKVEKKAIGRFLFRKLAKARSEAIGANAVDPSAMKAGGLAGLADKTVGKKVRKTMGGQCRLIVTGGAKPDVDMLKFFWTCGMPIFEGFVSTEVLLAILNGPFARCLGTAGTPPEGVDVKLSSAGEICVKSPMGTTGYFEQPEITKDSFDADGYFKTGDKGEWRTAADGKRYVEITGRIKDMIILDQRENVWPETLEGIFKRSPLVADCVIPMSCEGAGRAHLILLVAAADGASDQQLQAELSNHGSAAGIQPHEYPLQFVRVPEPFSKENGWRNANHKLMRKKIDEHWREDIDATFAKDASKLEHYYK